MRKKLTAIFVMLLISLSTIVIIPDNSPVKANISAIFI